MKYSEMVETEISECGGVLKLRGISLSVIPYNFYSPIAGIGFIVPIIPLGGESKPEQIENSMHISLEFEAIDGTFVLEPSKVILLYSGKEFLPIKMSKQYGSSEHRRSHSAGAIPGHCWECDYNVHRINSEDMQDIDTLEIKGNSCFMLEFPIKTIHPKEKFSFLIKGLKNNKDYIIVPEINFQPASTYGVERLG